MDEAQKEQEQINQQIKEIAVLLANIQDENLIYDFLVCLFTKSELKNISKRWTLVKELVKGTPQRRIAEKYNISLCNITRGSREIKKEGSAFPKALAILENLNGREK